MKGFVPTHTGEAEIHDDEFRIDRAELTDGLFTAVGHRDVESKPPREQPREGAFEWRIVLDEQDAMRRFHDVSHRLFCYRPRGWRS